MLQVKRSFIRNQYNSHLVYPMSFTSHQLPSFSEVFSISAKFASGYNLALSSACLIALALNWTGSNIYSVIEIYYKRVFYIDWFECLEIGGGEEIKEGRVIGGVHFYITCCCIIAKPKTFRWDLKLARKPIFISNFGGIPNDAKNIEIDVFKLFKYI